ncbi:hypothetical protein ABVK25_005476 [Lepraria finkii]|uniref:Zn(2)-C6 fungal-type domain-containing protein n=1 Tax=Lepraria finkii TaxID=1340010 RepID=A0ABR4B926_9LECA
MIPLPRQLNKHRISDSPIAAGSEESISFNEVASSETSRYAMLPQTFPNLCSALYTSSYENSGVDENFDAPSFVPVDNEPLPGYASAQASSISNVEGQAPKINTVPSSFVPHSTSKRKRNKRRFTEVEKAAIKNKRKVGVCADCRRTKRRCTHVLQHVPLESASIHENTSTSVKGGSSLGIGEIQEDGNSCEACRRRNIQNGQVSHSA